MSTTEDFELRIQYIASPQAGHTNRQQAQTAVTSPAVIVAPAAIAVDITPLEELEAASAKKR